jgi:hypothetical protein
MRKLSSPDQILRRVEQRRGGLHAFGRIAGRSAALDATLANVPRVFGDMLSTEEVVPRLADESASGPVARAAAI